MRRDVCRVPYRRSRFSTRLPDDRVYTRAHLWLLEEEPDCWRVGFTQFATRMLGDLVEFGFEVKRGTQVKRGEIVGWIEAFKATTDLFFVGDGEFLEGNPKLEHDPTLFDKDPYGEGWLYRFRGQRDPESIDVAGYVACLDAAIDKILGKPSEGNS